MSNGVEFDEDKLKYSMNPPGSPGGQSLQSREPKAVQWLLDRGIAKTPQSANSILIGLVVVNLILTYIIIKYFI